MREQSVVFGITNAKYQWPNNRVKVYVCRAVQWGWAALFCLEVCLPGSSLQGKAELEDQL